MAKSRAAQELLASLNDELAASPKSTGKDLVWSAQEREIIGMIGDAVDRPEELSAAYRAVETTSVRLRVATELRLTEQAVARLLRLVSTEVPAPLSVTSQKAQRAARSRWDRERMKQSNG
jgi:hypothetical protein